MIRAFFLTILLLASAIASAQSSQNDPESPAAPDITALEFRSYELGWIRYKNLDSDRQPKLSAEAGVKFPYMRVYSDTALQMDDLDAETIAALIDEHAIAYDEDALDGKCDPNKLLPHSADVFCQPGTQGMRSGHVFLALFDAETQSLLAITETIDNKSGGALRDWTPTATPESQPQESSAKPAGCGQYAAWQWIAAVDFVAQPGVEIVGGGANVASYQCVAPDEGSPYFQAHRGAAHAVNGGGGANGGGANGGDEGAGDGWSGSNRKIGRHGTYDDGGDNISIPIDPDPCTDPFGCDTGNDLE